MGMHKNAYYSVISNSLIYIIDKTVGVWFQERHDVKKTFTCIHMRVIVATGCEGSTEFRNLKALSCEAQEK